MGRSIKHPPLYPDGYRVVGGYDDKESSTTTTTTTTTTTSTLPARRKRKEVGKKKGHTVGSLRKKTKGDPDAMLKEFGF